MSSTLESSYKAELSFTSIPNTILLDTLKGGKADSEEKKKRSAATRKLTARGGVRLRENLTATAECDATLWALKPTLDGLPGKEKVTVTIHQLEDPQSDVVTAASATYTGILKSVGFPDFDLDGDNIGMVEFEVSADE